MKKEVRILLVGEPRVGKTTLVLSLVSEEFSAQVPARAEEITIPAEVTPEKVPTQIVDYSAQEQSDDQLREEIRKANVICLVYALNDENSIRQLRARWLPLIRAGLGVDQGGERVPIVLVGNKLDLFEEGNLEKVLPIMNEYPEVETCIECSARTLRNLSETFWFAQKAVLYPTGPLYVAEKKELSSPCTKALTRIFRICDMDNDGFLSDKELEAFQRRCFSIPLTTQSLEDIKHLVRRSLTTDGLTPNGITLKGFLFLHLVFLQKGRHETTWTVLRRFGYDNQLRLSPEYLRPKMHVPPGCSSEISQQGAHYLNLIFDKYDEDRDGYLSPRELAAMFATCPELPWGADVPHTVHTNPAGWISKRGYLAQWALTAYFEPCRALEQLAYLGYTYEFAEGLLSSLRVTRERRIDMHKRQTKRIVFYCRVYGARKVGKTCFLQGLLGRGVQSTAGLRREELPPWCAAGLPVYGEVRTLILHEVEAGRGEQMTQEEALSADVVCLLYDITDPESLKYVADLFLTFYRGTRVPCLLVGTKSEQVEVAQYYRLDAAEFTSKYRLAPPERVSCLLPHVPDDIYCRLLTMANYPHLRGLQVAQGDYGWKLTLAATVLAGFGFVAFKMAKTHL